MEYGIQLYSLRDITDKDLDGALRAVAEMGYKTVEFAGFFGHSAEEVRAMLDKYGLVCSGTHSGLGDLVNNFDETVKYHQTIGNHNYIIPGHDLSTKAKLDEFIAQCNEIAPKLREKGIELGYHNHSHEFILTAEGYEIHKELEERCDVFFELDTRHVVIAGKDPVEYAKKYSGRIPVLHARDTDGTADCAVGYGLVNFPEVVKAAKNIGLYIVENENFGTNEKQLLDSAEYLRKNF